MSTHAATGPTGRSPIVVVLGMHRSGTSALAGALSRLGFGLGRHLVPAAADNPLGYFENADAVAINETLLLDLGRGWDDLRPLPEGWRQSDAAAAARGRIDAWIADEAVGAAPFVLKDPRLCLTLPLWVEAFASAGVDVRVVLAHRALAEVQASIAARDGMAPRHALLLSLRHVLAAERDSRGLPRTRVSYDRLLADPAACLGGALQALGIAPPPSDQIRAAAAALAEGARHHRRSDAPQEAADLTAMCAEIERAAVEDAVTFTAQAHPDAWLAAVERCCALEAAVLQPRADALLLARRRAQHAEARARDEADALQGTQDLARARLGDVEALDDRLQRTERALVDTGAEVGRLRDAVQALESAKAEAEALALQRLQELATLDAALGEAQAVVARVASDAAEQVRERDARIEGLERELAALRESASSLARQIEAFKATRVWRAVALLNRLRRRLFGAGP